MSSQARQSWILGFLEQSGGFARTGDIKQAALKAGAISRVNTTIHKDFNELLRGRRIVRVRTGVYALPEYESAARNATHGPLKYWIASYVHQRGTVSVDAILAEARVQGRSRSRETILHYLYALQREKRVEHIHKEEWRSAGCREVN